MLTIVYYTMNTGTYHFYKDFYNTLYHQRKRVKLKLIEAKNIMLDVSNYWDNDG